MPLSNWPLELPENQFQRSFDPLIHKVDLTSTLKKLIAS